VDSNTVRLPGGHPRRRAARFVDALQQGHVVEELGGGQVRVDAEILWQGNHHRRLVQGYLGRANDPQAVVGLVTRDGESQVRTWERPANSAPRQTTSRVSCRISSASMRSPESRTRNRKGRRRVAGTGP
jgi:hypothetical protein